DDEIPEGEIRVTEIATGLDQQQRRVRPSGHAPSPKAGHDLLSDQVQIEHIESIQADSLEPVTSMSQLNPALPRSSDMEAESSGGEFESPFEDELETPAFLRRAQD
ncbi:hypothetical protein MK280_02460, partial [Myxococcota bacterium]|nr:hypothetical protein [Myxococcota bacterium]